MSEQNDILIQGATDYRDDCGNHIICQSENVNIHMKSNSCDTDIYIGRVVVGCVLEIYVRSNGGRIMIEDNCGFPSRSLIMLNGGKLYMAGGCTFGTGLLIILHNNTEINMGRDCMGSYDVNLVVGDGHRIFDIKPEKQLMS